eukprot:6738315-Lingulodinium_polyedra.AAC.1
MSGISGRRCRWCFTSERLASIWTKLPGASPSLWAAAPDRPRLSPAPPPGFPRLLWGKRGSRAVRFCPWPFSGPTWLRCRRSLCAF